MYSYIWQQIRYLDDWGKFLEKHKLPKLTAGAVEKSKQTCNK